MSSVSLQPKICYFVHMEKENFKKKGYLVLLVLMASAYLHTLHSTGCGSLYSIYFENQGQVKTEQLYSYADQKAPFFKSLSVSNPQSAAFSPVRGNSASFAFRLPNIWFNNSVSIQLKQLNRETVPNTIVLILPLRQQSTHLSSGDSDPQLG